MLSETVSKNKNAPIVLLFGGNPFRREEIIALLKTLGDITVYGTLSEEEGLNKLNELEKVNLVLIGGRYSDEQRVRIRSFVKTNRPNTKTTEPGYDYPYENNAILKHVKAVLSL